MLARTRLAFSGLVLTVMLAGCDDPAEPPDALTEAEALALFKSLEGGIGFGPGDDVDPGPVDTKVACALGGEARVVGTTRVGTAGDTARIAADVMVTPVGCKLSGDGLTFTVDGDPNIRILVTTDIIRFENMIVGGGAEGKITWRMGDQSGDCSIHMPLEATIDFSNPEDPKVTGGYSGRMCGHDIELGVSLSG